MSGVTHLPLRVLPGEGPVSMSCSADAGRDALVNVWQCDAQGAEMRSTGGWRGDGTNHSQLRPDFDGRAIRKQRNGYPNGLIIVEAGDLMNAEKTTRSP